MVWLTAREENTVQICLICFLRERDSISVLLFPRYLLGTSLVSCKTHPLQPLWINMSQLVVRHRLIRKQGNPDAGDPSALSHKRLIQKNEPFCTSAVKRPLWQDASAAIKERAASGIMETQSGPLSLTLAIKGCCILTCAATEVCSRLMLRLTQKLGGSC